VIDVPLHKFLDADGERRVRAVTSSHDVNAEDARRSVSLVKVLRQYGEAYSLLDVTIKTGRTHQIRVHLQHEGHAIVGDAKYGQFELNRALARGEALPGHRFERMFLHARQPKFSHPASGEDVTLAAPLPPECEALLKALETL
jgi:23S rRNA pseudouridine955/2504/2580 synthase